MRFVLYTNVLSPHQLPLAKEIVAKVGIGNFRYVYNDSIDKLHAGLAFYFDVDECATGCILKSDCQESRDWLENADILLCGNRDFSLFERRGKAGLKTYYMSERWFKPIPLLYCSIFGRCFDVLLPGWVRVFHPKYFSYIRKVRKMVGAGILKLLPIGVHAQRDFLRMGIPSTAIMLWGYFVSPSAALRQEKNASILKVMWCGRRVPLKHVETIVMAVSALTKRGCEVLLDLYSDLSLAQVREEMRCHDVFVFPSNGCDGWGAVVSEALEEGMVVLGSHEAGATATLLPDSQLFNCTDWRRLAELLQACLDPVSLHAMKHDIGDWSAGKAALRLLNDYWGK